MKVALVHDDLVQWGGAERVFLAISNLFPKAPIYTTVFDNYQEVLADKFKDKKIITSFLQKIPGWRGVYKGLLPLYPIAFEQFDFFEYDLIISHTTRFAKSIITKPKHKHICYCHTPPRFLWNFSGEKVSIVLNPYLTILRYYDQISSKRVDKFLAGSNNAKIRIEKIYKEKSTVVYPFVEDIFFNTESFDGGYFLILSRLNHYKRVDLAVKVFNELKLKLKVVGIGPELMDLKRQARENVEILGGVSENLLLNLLAGCSALIICGEEDFGITSLEAQAMGKGVIAFKKGGVLETVIEGKTGIFFQEQTEKSLKDALLKFGKKKILRLDCINNAKRFNLETFQENFLKALGVEHLNNL